LQLSCILRLEYSSRLKSLVVVNSSCIFLAAAPHAMRDANDGNTKNKGNNNEQNN